MSRTILVTGADGNLGKDVIPILVEAGHQIIAVRGRNELPEALEVSLLASYTLDLRDEAATTNTVEEILHRFPELDAALLFAGGFKSGKINVTDEAMIDEFISLNFKTAWFVVRPLMNHFEIKGFGQFVLMGARPAIVAEAAKSSVAYALSKSLLLTMADIINAEGKDKQINASVIIPTILDTAPNRKDMPDADFSTWVKTATVADTIKFIMSDAGRKMRQPVFKL